MIVLNPHRIYVSGRISGLPREVYRGLFGGAAAEIRALGHIPVNPLEIASADDCGCPDVSDAFHGHDWACCLRKDIHVLLGCQGIRMLPNWPGSKGARLERRIAVDLGLPVYLRSEDLPMIGHQVDVEAVAVAS